MENGIKEQVYISCLEAIASEDFDYVLDNIQIIFNDEGNELFDENMCMTHLMYVEALMGVKTYDKELINIHLNKAQKYSEKVNDEGTRIILEICILIDYTKYYLETEQVKLAERYAYDAICASFSFEIPEDIVYRTIINFISVLNKMNEGLSNNVSIAVYSDILFVIDNMNIDFHNNEYSVILKYLLFSFFLEKGDYENAKDYFEQGYSKEIVSDKCIYHTYNCIVRYKACLEKIFEGDYLKNILLTIAYTTKYRVNNVLLCTNVDEVLNFSRNITYILRLILSFENKGILKLSEEELVEIIVNLKNILPDMLYIWKYASDVKTVNWRWMSFNEVCDLVPNNTCYMDYVQFPYVLREETILADLALMIISINKYEDEIKIIRHNPVLLLQERYLNLILNSSIRANLNDANSKSLFNILNSKSMPNSLYNLIMEKTEKKISCKCDKIIISGDVEITSIPFCALKDNQGKYLIDKYNIIMMNSIRNINLEESIFSYNLNNSLVLGNPEYTINRELLSQINENCLTQLPLSKIEANIVSDYLGVKACVKKEANINKFVNAKCELLHIATHGQILQGKEEEKELDPLSYSCMYLAGANDYIITGKTVEGYGTGRITAKEMYKFDFRSVKIAVFSMCFSGNGEVDYSQGLIGFKTVMLANKVREIVSCLWEADDFASAVLIKKMYENMKDMKPSEALRKAQQYLKSVSILELKNEGWFEDKLIKKVGLVAEEMRRIAQTPDYVKIFSEPKYWAGYNITLN